MKKNKFKILVVDDQPGLRYLMEVILRETGHQTQTAENGLDALEKARHFKPDLVFMDIRMPVMDGLEALGKIKIMLPNTEVIMMTANSTEDSFSTAMQKGAFKCMAKPFDVEDIRKTIDEFIWEKEKTSDTFAL
ncbi:response regulator [Desulfofalx alkaliphila]|uniref:response regulator n=1 Tax=Desulfofalx alkaliphila TaxID=105483 RepID=UPI0004E1BB6B|nr:response regulator [Desulfofalx alkaliphila]